QSRVVEHDVRSLGGTGPLGFGAQILVGHVGPRAGCVDNDLGVEVEFFAGEHVAQLGGACVDSGQLDVVAGACLVVGVQPFAQHVQGQSFGVVYRSVEVGGGVLHVIAQFWKIFAGCFAVHDVVTWVVESTD